MHGKIDFLVMFFYAICMRDKFNLPIVVGFLLLVGCQSLSILTQNTTESSADRVKRLVSEAGPLNPTTDPYQPKVIACPTAIDLRRYPLELAPASFWVGLDLSGCNLRTDSPNGMILHLKDQEGVERESQTLHYDAAADLIATIWHLCLPKGPEPIILIPEASNDLTSQNKRLKPGAYELTVFVQLRLSRDKLKSQTIRFEIDAADYANCESPQHLTENYLEIHWTTLNKENSQP